MPAGGPALDVRGRKAPGATVQDPATHRHCWRQAVLVPKIGLGGLPRPVSLKAAARRCSARPGAEAVLSVSVRAAASTACMNENPSFILPSKHRFYHAGQSQDCLRAVRRQCPQPRHAPLQIKTRNPCAAVDNAPGSQASRWKRFKGSNGRGQAADYLKNVACREFRKHASQTLESDPAATILQREAEHQRQKHVSADCPPVRIQRHVLRFAPSRGGFERRGADPTFTGTGPPSTAFRAAEASTSAAMACL